MIFVVERVVTVWAAGWRGRLLALPLVIEIGYDLVLQAVYIKSIFDIATGREAGWNYVPRQAARSSMTLLAGILLPARVLTRAGSRPSPPS